MYVFNVSKKVAPPSHKCQTQGLRFGKLYGFAVPNDFMDRDPWHKANGNGGKVEGKWLPISWQWDGTAKNFAHDGSWDFTVSPPGFPEYKYWNANGQTIGAKMEHNTPDPRPGKTGFIQGSTAGYIGHYYVADAGVAALQSWTLADGFPTELAGEYYAYEGERDIRRQIELGGQGLYRDGYDATVNYSKENKATG